VKLDERRAGRPPTSAAVAAQWFAQDLFEGAEDDEDDEDGRAEAPRVQRGKRAKPSAGAHQQIVAHGQSQHHTTWLHGQVPRSASSIGKATLVKVLYCCCSRFAGADAGSGTAGARGER